MATYDAKPTNVYCVAFGTHDQKTGKPHAGYIKAVQITIEEIVMDSTDAARIDLVDHPLYPQLEQYVLMNRSKR